MLFAAAFPGFAGAAGWVKGAASGWQAEGCPVVSGRRRLGVGFVRNEAEDVEVVYIVRVMTASAADQSELAGESACLALACSSLRARSVFGWSIHRISAGPEARPAPHARIELSSHAALSTDRSAKHGARADNRQPQPPAQARPACSER
jgi:hypothetical protein